MLSLLLFVVLYALFHPVAALTGGQTADDLRPQLSAGSSIYLPGNANYSHSVTPRWDTYIKPSYLVAVQPALITDVQKIIQYVIQKNISILATGGGHGSLTTLTDVQHAIDIDLSKLNSVKINAKGTRLTIGGSVRFRDITSALQAASREMPIASHSCVGVVGATLGGGIGPYSGLYGLIADSLDSIDMVIGMGEIRTVTRTNDFPTLWGMKGAGFNYGIVTSATYRTYPATNKGQAMNADLTFNGVLNASVWQVFKRFAGNQSNRLHLSATMGFNATSNQIYIQVNAIYAGPLDKGRQAIRHFLSLQPTKLNITMVTFSSVQDANNYGLGVSGCKPHGVVTHGVNLLNRTYVEGMVQITNYMARAQAANSALQDSTLGFTQFSTYGVNQPPQQGNTTSYPYRETVAYINIQASIPDGSSASAAKAWGAAVRNIARSIGGKQNNATYTNYGNGDESQKAFYSTLNLPPLRDMKWNFDFYNLFGHYAAVSKDWGHDDD